MSLRIIPFKPAYAPAFKELNLAWLKTYFYVEPKDKELLENCEHTIMKKGGYIFFAAYNDTIVGCFSFIRLNEKEFELGKMAVDPQFQGRKIGQKLLEYAIDFAKSNRWDKIILYSNTILEPAIYLYKKYGFIEIQLEKEIPYKRSNIKMELKLQ